MTGSSTEVLRPASLISGWHEVNSARLPKPLVNVRLVNVDNRVLLFGEWRYVNINTTEGRKNPSRT